MLTVACMQSKGGAGKSTLAQNISVEAAGRGLQVVAADLDPSQSFAKWWRRRDGPSNPFLALDPGNMTAYKLALQRKATLPDVMVIDTPGELLNVIRDAVMVADVIVVPLAPSIKDWESMDAVEAMIASAGKQANTLYVVNRYRANTESSIEIRRALHKRTGAIPLTVALATDHERADAQGKTGAEINNKIAGEIGLLWQEIERIGTGVQKDSIRSA